MSARKHQVSTHEAKTHLSQLLRRVAIGEEVIICSGKTPVARLLPLERPAAPRVAGRYEGQIWMSPDFDEENELISAFGSSKIDP